MPRSNDILSCSKISCVGQDDTESRLRDVIMKLDAHAGQPGNKINYLKYINDYLITAERITFDSSNDKVIVKHEDGTEVQISEEEFALINEALSQFNNRTSRGDASTPQIDSNRNTPPNRAEMLLHFALPKRDRECMIGDLEEEYRRVILPKYGARVAARWYWWQAVRSVAAASGARARVWLSFGGLAKAAGWIVEKFGL